MGEGGVLSFNSQFGTIKEILFASYGMGMGGDPFGKFSYYVGEGGVLSFNSQFGTIKEILFASYRVS